MKTLAYLMSDDAKWMEKELDLPYTPHPGTDLDGLVGEQPLRINGMSYNVNGDFFKLRLAWLSHEAMHSSEMVKLGWTVK